MFCDTHLEYKKSTMDGKGIQVLWSGKYEKSTQPNSIYQNGEEDGSPTRPYWVFCLIVFKYG